jgi:hypothetical protein
MRQGQGQFIHAPPNSVQASEPVHSSLVPTLRLGTLSPPLRGAPNSLPRSQPSNLRRTDRDTPQAKRVIF